MITYQIPFIFSSDPASGAIRRNQNGSSFEVVLDSPIHVPNNAKHCWLEVQNTQIWNSVPNILTGVNDKMYISDSLGDFTLTIPQGLYDIASLNDTINRLIIDQRDINNLIVLVGDNSTQKVYIEIHAGSIQIDFTQPDTFRDLIGFNSQTLITPAPDPLTYYTFVADNIANFNTTEYFLIHCDLIHNGLRVNNTYNQTVSQTSINVPPGSVVISEPDNPPKIESSELIGNPKTLVRIWITNQRNQDIDMNGEYFSFRLVINYVA